MLQEFEGRKVISTKSFPIIDEEKNSQTGTAMIALYKARDKYRSGMLGEHNGEHFSHVLTFDTFDEAKDNYLKTASDLHIPVDKIDFERECEALEEKNTPTHDSEHTSTESSALEKKFGFAEVKELFFVQTDSEKKKRMFFDNFFPAFEIFSNLPENKDIPRDRLYNNCLDSLPKEISDRVQFPSNIDDISRSIAGILHSRNSIGASSEKEESFGTVSRFNSDTCSLIPLFSENSSVFGYHKDKEASKSGWTCATFNSKEVDEYMLGGSMDPKNNNFGYKPVSVKKNPFIAAYAHAMHCLNAGKSMDEVLLQDKKAINETYKTWTKNLPEADKIKYRENYKKAWHEAVEFIRETFPDSENLFLLLKPGKASDQKAREVQSPTPSKPSVEQKETITASVKVQAKPVAKKTPSRNSGGRSGR